MIKATANLLHATGIQRPEQLVGPDWSTPPGSVTDYSSQLSGIFLEEAAAIADLPMVYRDVNYHGSWSSLPAGSYTLAQLNARGIAASGYAVGLPPGDYDLFALQRAGVVNDDISSFTLTGGHTLSLFQELNFTGAQVTQTSSNSCLVGLGFNDNVSSLRVTTP